MIYSQSVSAEGDPETKIGREDEEHEDVLMNYRFGPEHLPGSRPRPTELFECAYFRLINIIIS
jgi:hypothetical protein